MADHHQLSNAIWQITDVLRGLYHPTQYGRVILPMTVLRRLDCVLAPTKELVLLNLAKQQIKHILRLEAIAQTKKRATNQRS